MSETRKRVFWTQAERQALADEMHRLLESDPLQSKLQAVLKAQQVLPAERRRAVPAWTTVQEQIEPYLKIARSNARAAAVPDDAAGSPAQADLLVGPAADAAEAADAPPAAASRPGDAADAGASDDPADRPPAAGPPDAPGMAGVDDELVGRLAGLLAQQVDLLTQLGSRILSDALAGALASPAVEAKLAGLVQTVLARTAANGLPAAGAAQAPGPRAVATKPKVLLAGLPPAQANELSEEFAQTLDIRHWRTTETAEQLRSLARHCAIAVAMVEAVDPATEALLKSMQLRYIRHTGGLDRLKKRLHELLDHGVLNLLSS